MPVKHPAFFVQHPEGDLTTDFLLDEADSTREVRVGACLLLPRQFRSKQQYYVSSWKETPAFVLADPESRRIHFPESDRGRARRKLPYLTTKTPAKGPKQFVEAVIKAQVDVGATTIVSPSLIHGLTAKGSNLDSTLEFASIASESPQLDGRPLLMGVDATSEIFADQDARDHFLDAIVQHEPALPVFLRMTIDRPESRRPYGDGPAITGLRKAVEALVANGHNVVLPQSGLVGWLMLGFGASSFGAGALTASMERNLRPTNSPPQKGGNPSLHWYFSPDLLGPVLAEELPDLHAAGVAVCECPYCKDAPPQAGDNFDKKQAGLHYLWWLTQFAAELQGATEPASVVRNRLEAAAANWHEVLQAGVVLDPRTKEKHLAAWIQATAS